ncbi:MAG: hypothetical protein IKZ53_02185 [Selenomonadaceae bacterium]|nr:hypothetical protein [Selenomonadaceae bacterium]
MRIYLDNCCLGRPFDNQSFPRIFIETQAKLFIQGQIKSGKIEMATSYILHYENILCSNEAKRESVEDFLKSYSSIYIDITFADKVVAKAEKFISEGIKSKDAYHVASAILAECDYFLTTDDRLMKHKVNEIIMINPLEFVQILEAN